MRTGAILLLVAGLACAGEPRSYRQLVAPDTVLNDLSGKVREVETTVYELDEEGAPALVSEDTMTFDPAGYLLTEIEQDYQARAKTTTTCVYDASGALVEERKTDASGAVTVAKVRFLPEPRRQIKEKAEAGGRFIPVEETVFDAFGKEGETRSYDARGNLESVARMTRNASGKETQVLYLSPTEKLQTTVTISWEGPREVREVEEASDRKTRKITAYEYPGADLQGNWLEQIATETDIENGLAQPDVKSRIHREITYYP